MNIILIGYGKMGKTIDKIARSRGHHIQAVIDVDNHAELQSIQNPDAVAIEFTQPESAVENLKVCMQNRIPVVCGTTGWLDHKPSIEQLCQTHQNGFFYASNYSIGVNIFFKLNEYLAKVMQHYPEYTPSITEIHHTEKKDAPSGTAITLAEGVLANYPSKKGWKNEMTSAAEAQLGIVSLREPNVPGTHTIQYSSTIDDISITHLAHSREGFATGAVLAAEWLQGKKGVFGMPDLLNNVFSKI